MSVVYLDTDLQADPGILASRETIADTVEDTPGGEDSGPVLLAIAIGSLAGALVLHILHELVRAAAR